MYFCLTICTAQERRRLQELQEGLDSDLHTKARAEDNSRRSALGVLKSTSREAGLRRPLTRPHISGPSAVSSVAASQQPGIADKENSSGHLPAIYMMHKETIIAFTAINFCTRNALPKKLCIANTHANGVQ